ncbi:MAG TPA: hypothetical protein VHB73_04570 [Alphaproteobacteria bacterium]|nr:hypothetical protein [Alphaproteobacteria bacterium]
MQGEKFEPGYDEQALFKASWEAEQSFDFIRAIKPLLKIRKHWRAKPDHVVNQHIRRLQKALVVQVRDRRRRTMAHHSVFKPPAP